MTSSPALTGGVSCRFVKEFVTFVFGRFIPVLTDGVFSALAINMFTNKLFGWVLLAVGLAIIGYCLYSSWGIFTAKNEAPQIFKVAQQLPAASQKKGAQDLQAQLEQAMQSQIQGAIGQMLPSDSIPKMLNLASWSIFAAILVLIGGKVGELGIRMLKKD